MSINVFLVDIDRGMLSVVENVENVENVGRKVFCLVFLTETRFLVYKSSRLRGHPVLVGSEGESR